MKDKLIALVGRKGQLPPLPDILGRLSSLIDDPGSGLDDIARLIETEPVLAGKLITLANSVFYGGGMDRAPDIHTAVMRLGLKIVLDLTYTLTLPKTFYKCKLFNQRQFWRHSLSVACLARGMANRGGFAKEEVDAAYLAGLTHDVGILVFGYLLPDEYSNFLKTASASTDKPLEALEQEAFGIAHPELGAQYIRKWWQVKPPVLRAVELHHNYEMMAAAPAKDCAQAVLAANGVMNGNKLHNGIGIYCHPVEMDYFKRWGISEGDLRGLIEQAKENLQVMEGALNR